MKRLLSSKALVAVFSLLIVLALVVSGCAKKATPTPAPKPAATPTPAPAVTPAPTPVKVYEWRATTVVTPEDPSGKGLQKFKEVAEQRSGGRLKITVQQYLVAQREEPGAVRSGVVEAVFPAPSSFFQSLVAELALFDLPFVFDNEDMYFEVLNRLKPDMDKRFAEVNMVPLAWTNYGSRSIDSKAKPVLKLEDIKGMKFRVMASPLILESWKAWGVQTVAIGAEEVPTALESGTIDAIDYTWVAIWTLGLSDLIRHITLSDHAVTPTALVANKQAFEALPGDLQEVVREAGKAVLPVQAAERKNAEATLRKQMEAKGIVFHDLPSGERERFRAALPGVYESAAAKYGDFGKRFFDTVAQVRKERTGK